MCGGIVLEEALDLSFDRLLLMMDTVYKSESKYTYLYMYTENTGSYEVTKRDRSISGSLSNVCNSGNTQTQDLPLVQPS